MTCTLKKCAVASCVSILLAGCASNPGIAPEYRISSSSAEIVDGASMLQRGRAQLGAGLDALAIESFRAEIRQNPESADAYNGLAVAYGRIGRSDLAQRYFETALAKDPGNIKVQANLAKLNGDPAPVIQLAANIAAPPLYDPVAVSPVADDVAIGRVLESLEMPTLALADLAAPVPVPSTVQEVLGKRGVLSARFMAAPMQMATNASASLGDRHPLRELPGRKPSDPEPALPASTLFAEARKSGTRLERVSLGEVRLVTMTYSPALPAKTKTNFATFGDRLSVWLPKSIAVEQSARTQRPAENFVMLAAIERAQNGHSVAALDISEIQEMEKFAYIFFDTDSEIDAA